MIAKGGSKLINNSAISFKKNLINKAFLVTPNIPEAEILTNIKIYNEADMIRAGKKLLDLEQNALLKGGHSKSKYLKDILFSKKEIKIFKNKKIVTQNTHGNH